MKTKTRLSIVLALVGFGTLVLLGMPPMPHPKAQAQRIHSVNSIVGTFPKTMVFTNGVITSEASSPMIPAHGVIPRGESSIPIPAH